MEVITNNGTYFNELNRSAKTEIIAENTRMPSIANTYKNEPQFQNVFNLSANYARTGQQKFADPFAFHARPVDKASNGRNLNILNTLAINAQRDSADVITANPLRVVGFY